MPGDVVLGQGWWCIIYPTSFVGKSCKDFGNRQASGYSAMKDCGNKSIHLVRLTNKWSDEIEKRFFIMAQLLI
jgi:hypothetical protein